MNIENHTMKRRHCYHRWRENNWFVFGQRIHQYTETALLGKRLVDRSQRVLSGRLQAQVNGNWESLRYMLPVDRGSQDRMLSGWTQLWLTVGQ